ncbi:hypothetical protein SORBI_3002G417401 [Sorghum bicolor]|uniref:Uncharacterized protein n=1 Tax=Sorghum bicolor TaxID=4558 RepID=A0A1W0W7W7_SORBI|nr:hypothetical protein SORBI_3002G417401 [Sorghum bicolor]
MAVFGWRGCSGERAWVAVVGASTGCYSRRHGHRLLHASTPEDLAAPLPLPIWPSLTSTMETASSIWRHPLPPPHLQPHPLLQRISSSPTGGFIAQRWQSGKPDTRRSLASCL